MFWLVYKQSLYWKFKDGENGLNWSKVSLKFMIIIESCKTIEWLLGQFPLGINLACKAQPIAQNADNSKKKPSYFRQIIVIEEKLENKLFLLYFL